MQEKMHARFKLHVGAAERLVKEIRALVQTGELFRATANVVRLSQELGGMLTLYDLGGGPGGSDDAPVPGYLRRVWWQHVIDLRAERDTLGQYLGEMAERAAEIQARQAAARRSGPMNGCEPC